MLDINLRQKAGTELLWVTLEQASPTLIKIVPVGVAPGDYTLILQSFDNNGSVKSTLKQDSITITVLLPEPTPTPLPVLANDIETTVPLKLIQILEA